MLYLCRNNQIRFFMNLGYKIKQLREANKMSQLQLATQLDISQSTLHRMETRKSYKIDFLLMSKLCDIFDKNYTYFSKDLFANVKIK